MRTLVVPAAGLGTRLAHTLPKLLVPVAGRPMIEHLLTSYGPHVAGTVVIVHPSVREQVSRALAGRDVTVTTQSEPTGMLDAILAASRHVSPSDHVWITWCDQIAIAPATVLRLTRLESAADLVMPTSTRQSPYIHFERHVDGRIARVLQRREGDVMPPAGESDAGLFSLSWHAWSDMLPEFAESVPRSARTGERNFLPFVPWMAARAVVRTFPCEDPIEAVGINTPEELRLVEAHLRGRTHDVSSRD